MRFRLELLLAALLLVGGSGPAAPRRAARPRSATIIAAPRAGQPLDDDVVYNYLEAEGRKLLAADQLSNHHDQLNRTSCALKLVLAGTTRLEPAEIYRRAQNSVVVIGELYWCDKCRSNHFGTASGFVISDSGAVVTCRHVVGRRDTRGWIAMTRDGVIHRVREILATSAADDVAILQLDGSGFTALPLSTNAPAGSSVTVISHPEEHFYTLTAGLVSRYYSEVRRQRPTTWMTITAGFAKGSSGAPVFNECGAVVGIVNNTESIYYEAEKNRQTDLQMVVNNCTPTASLLAMIRPK